MLADLHVHSIYSDGWYSPEEVCACAARKGIELLSITDHDTLAGEDAKRAAAKKYGVQYVTGWEISAYAGAQKLHILGYNCQLNGAYFDFMQRRKEAALLRAEDSVQKMRGLGVEVTMEEVLSERSSAELPVHTMHVARAIAKRLGIVEGEAYLRYLGLGMPAQSNIGRPTPLQAIECIHACGGIASVAHPGRISLDGAEKEKMLLQLVEYGVDGIEGVYTTHTEEETARFIRFAEERGLFVTGGSDTHFEEQTHAIGKPNFSPSEGLLQRLGIV